VTAGPAREAAAAPAAMPGLRPYQRQAAAAILRAALRGEGGSISIEFARQGGKNEVSAQVEAMLLVRHLNRPLTAVKCAPTFRPQAEISLARLRERLTDAGLGPWFRIEQGHTLRLGRARQVFLSAEPGSNVVGHTADLLLEVDEAQDVDQEKFDKEFRPMAASTGAPVVFYGTPWDDLCLLERAKQANLEAERRDGRRRHFEYDWQVVAEFNPAYGRYVEGERDRLGSSHPLFLTQYSLKTIPGAGRLLSETHLSLLNGGHDWLNAPLAGDVYVAGLDIAGEAAVARDAARHDSTVLTVARLVRPQPAAFGEPEVEAVRVYIWTGEPNVSVQGALASLLAQTWRVAKVAVDATGIGEPVAAFLKTALGAGRVEARKLSAESESSLGFELIAAVNSGRLRLPGPSQEGPELAECRRQLSLCRVVYRANRTMNFFVEARDGHDDCVVSLALAVAAAQGAGPRRARGRLSEDFDLGGC
jgi:hypothetical protein